MFINMNAQKFKTLKEYQEANQLAHETLIKEKGYTSESYGNDIGIETTDGCYLLFELEGFEKQLKDAGFDFIEFNVKEIKVNDLL